jgi:hypothetical protein
MTDLTARELIDTILRSLAATRATFKKKTTPPLADERSSRQSVQNQVGAAEEAVDFKTQ